MAAAARVVDTSAWIEWLTGSDLGEIIGKALPERPHCIVPTIVQLELSKWLVREVGEDAADQVIAYTQKCVVVPLDTTIALLAADMHRQHKARDRRRGGLRHGAASGRRPAELRRALPGSARGAGLCKDGVRLAAGHATACGWCSCQVPSR